MLRIATVFVATALLAASAAAQARPGSIYDPSRGPRGLIAEKTALAKGDILTVVISETTNPAPKRRHSVRKGRSVTPAIGARMTGGSMT